MIQLHMQLYLLRHGIAEDGKPGQPDDERALTPEGVRKLHQVLRVAGKAGVLPATMLTSPYLRARQTAKIAAEVLRFTEALTETPTLTPASEPEQVWTEIRVYKDDPQVMLVGHEPLLSRIASYLLATPTLQVDFKKGAIVRIDIESFGPQPRGILKWMLVPKLAG